MVDKVGDDSETDQAGVGDDIQRRRPRIAGHIHLRFNVALGEAAEDRYMLISAMARKRALTSRSLPRPTLSTAVFMLS